MKIKFRSFIQISILLIFCGCASTSPRIPASEGSQIPADANMTMQKCVQELRSKFRDEGSEAKISALNHIFVQITQTPYVIIDGAEVSTNQLFRTDDQDKVLVYVEPNQDAVEWNKNLLAQCKSNLLARLQRFGL